MGDRHLKIYEPRDNLVANAANLADSYDRNASSDVEIVAIEETVFTAGTPWLAPSDSCLCDCLPPKQTHDQRDALRCS